MHISRPLLQRLLGGLWLIDGLLQLQPRMYTMDMVHSVMIPMLQSQPGFIGANLQWIVQQTVLHLAAVNLLITVVQVGLGLLFLSNHWVKGVVVASIVWALIVWYAGEGLSMLLTGQSSILTGAPGAVLFYPLLGLAIWPLTPSSGNPSTEEGLLSRQELRRVLAGFWIFAALLQLQPIWWQSGLLSQTIGGLLGAGGLNGLLIDPVLRGLSTIAASLEIPLNIALIVVFLGLGITLAVVEDEHIHPILMVSLVVSVVIWYVWQACGGILTGMATDFNSGLLLVVIAWASFPRSTRSSKARVRVALSMRRAPEAGLVQRPAEVEVAGRS